MACKITDYKDPRLGELIQQYGQAEGLKAYLAEKSGEKIEAAETIEQTIEEESSVEETIPTHSITEIRKEIGATSPLFSNQIGQMATKLFEYNDKNGTAHTFSQIPIGESDRTKIKIHLNYHPVSKEKQQERIARNTDAPGMKMSEIEKKVNVAQNREELRKVDMASDDLTVWRGQLRENFDTIFPTYAEWPGYLKTEYINSLTEGDLNTYC